MFSNSIGIDLGAHTSRVFIKGRGIVLKEPSVVALDRTSQKIVGTGSEATKLIGRTNGNIIAVHPIKNGIITDYALTERLIKSLIQKVSKFRLVRPNIVVCVHGNISDVEARAVMDAGTQAGARRVFLIPSTVASLMGAGVDIKTSVGNMVVDIGSKNCDIAVISSGRIAVSKTLKPAGDSFDEAVIKCLRRKHNLQIGEMVAEKVKLNIARAYPNDDESTAEVHGRCLMTGLPKTVSVTSGEIAEALRETVDSVSDAICYVLENTPRELVSDISRCGITLTGGGSLLKGIDNAITQRIGIRTRIADDAISCAVLGVGKALENLSAYADNTLNIGHRYIIKA